MNNTIIIDKIIARPNGDIEVIIYIGSSKEVIKINVSDNVRQYITLDRADAAVMGLLMFAIRHDMNICSRLPISETLYYKLVHHFIPGICGSRVYQPKIDARVVSDLVPNGNKGIIATGISCGVDSLYTIMEHTDKVTDGFKLNHLVFLDAGAHHFGSKDKWDTLYRGRLDNAIKFSTEMGLPLIEITTNLPEVLEKYSFYDHIEQHTYMMLSCILMIQRGVSRYYYSGGYPYNQFNCNLLDNEPLGCAHYDPIILWCASNANIEFFSAGGSVNRFEKIKALRHFRLAEKYLNVCVQSIKNCGKCFKCKRTLLELDAAGIINKYGEVFNLEEYEMNRKRLIYEGYRNTIKGDKYLYEIGPFFEKNIPSTSRLMQRIRVMCGKIVSLFR